MRSTGVLCLLLAACGDSGTTSRGAELSGFRIARIHVDGIAIEAWFAETAAQREQGLMHATPDQLAPLPDGTPRGMLFVFSAEQPVSFTMRDTIIALDLAHFRGDGTLSEVHPLTPLDEDPVPSAGPVRYSLEMRAGDLAAYGLAPGSTLSLPLP